MARSIAKILTIVMLCTYAFEASSMHLLRASRPTQRTAHHSPKKNKMIARVRAKAFPRAYHSSKGRPSQRLTVMNQLRLADPVRKFHGAFQRNQLDTIHRLLPYAGHWDPVDGSTSFYKAIMHLEGESQQNVLEKLFAIGVNPMTPSLRTWESAIQMSTRLQEIRTSTENMDGLSTCNQYYLLELLSIASFVKTFVGSQSLQPNSKRLIDTPTDKEIEAYISYFRAARKQLEEENLTTGLDRDSLNQQAKLLVSSLIHNVGAATTALLSPLVNAHAESFSSIPANVLAEMEITNPLELNAGLLARTGLFDDSEAGEQKIQVAKKIARKLTPVVIVKMAKLISILMRNEEVRLFDKNPDMAILHLLENFSEMAKLPYGAAHERAYVKIAQTILKIKSVH